jgi:two-component system phosphate regulon sensor histidine kinase PhoR
MIRNPKPVNVAFVIALILSCLLGVSVFVIREYSWQDAVLAFIACLLFSFVLFYYSLEFFIYRKIKLIYKTIHSLKTNKYDAVLSNFSWTDDPIANMNKEVISWASDQKQAMDELKRLADFRKEFLGNVSHELKTPVFNIQGYIHTLLDGAIHDPEVNVRFLTKAARSADRLSDLVDDLLAISQLETGGLAMAKDVFDINLLTKDVFEQFETRAREREITLQVKEGCNHAFFVEADRYRIRQVMVNLVGNAIKYGNDKGSVVVSYYDMDENILVEVADDGEGIAQEHIPRIFERFYRVDRSRTRESGPGGTGLGLAIVKHIIEAHDQAVNVRSTLGDGTTFAFTLRKGTGS